MTGDMMQLTEWLDDLCVRFIINLPVEELSTAARICFQIEEAQWFYEDFVRPLNPSFPSLNLRAFTAVMFQHCPLLKGYTIEDQDRAFQSFLEYKTMVPVRGAIMLNNDMDHIVLVKGWKKGANWSFPRGKIDQNELDLTCAVREVYEETGYDLKEAGLVGLEEDTKSIDIQIRGQDLKMYIFRGVPMETDFAPRTRKEISKVQWHKLSELPTLKSKKQQREGQTEDLAFNANKFYMVAPFLGPLKKWIAQQKKRDKSLLSTSHTKLPLPNNTIEAENMTSDQEAIEDQRKDEEIENDHLSRLLHTLRQSSQAMTSDLPEVSQNAESTKDATQVESLKSADLKAVLFGAEPQPIRNFRSPFDKLVEEPSFPRSPPYERPPQTLGSSKPSGFPVSMQQPEAIDQHPMPHLTSNFFTPVMKPEVRPVPLSSQPVKLAPRSFVPDNSASIKDKIFPPSQSTQQNNIQDASFVREHQPFVAPPASKLPVPTLNPQKSALLGLFKAEPSTKASESGAPMLIKSSATSESKGPESVKAPAVFLPPQVSRISSEKIPQEGSTTATQQAKLLDLFRTPTLKSAGKGLEPPEPAVELSASPKGGHSRNNSHIDTADQAARPPSKDAILGQVKIQKRPQRDEGPVSATVTGPLNNPQFDMIRQASHEKRDQADSKEPVKVSPIQILSRPTSSHKQVSPPSQLSASQNPPKSFTKGPSQSAAKLTPSKGRLPPTPDLKPRDTQSKPFQPQILRRPGTSHYNNEPSPIQPLPSPKHKTIISKDSALPNDHKKSLLSLFTKPSPFISPPSAGPAQEDEISAIISPIEKAVSSPPAEKKSFQPDVFAPASIAATLKSPAEPQAPAKQQTRRFYAPDRMPAHLSGTSVNEAKAPETNGARMNGERHMSTASSTSTITPANQEYLLGFLKALK